MKHTRPKNLNLFTIHFPIPAIVSILHRISGFVLFLIIPLLLWMLNASLSSMESFDALQAYLAEPFIKFILWGSLSAFIFHLVAGVRHLLMDGGVGESLKGSRIGSWSTIAISLILIILTGIWLW